MDINPEHGRDFLYNFYTILGVDPIATRDEIAAAFRDKQRQYHPDRYIGLADELAGRARQMSEVLSLAYQTLGNSKNREEYDALLAEWDGPISRDGVPILDLRRVSVANILQFSDASWLALNSRVEQLTGDDQQTFDLLQEQYQASENPSKKLTEAYAKALERRLVRYSVTEAELLTMLGASEIKYLSLETHIQVVEQQIAARRSEIKELAPGIVNLMLTAGEESEPTSEQVEQVTAVAMQRYEEVGKQIKQISQERQAVANQLLQLPHLRRYQPAQDQFTPNVFIGLDFGNHIFWCLFQIQDGSANMDVTSFSEEEMQSLQDPEYAEEVIRQGYNILLVQHLENIEPSEQIAEAIQHHVKRMTS